MQNVYCQSCHVHDNTHFHQMERELKDLAMCMTIDILHKESKRILPCAWQHTFPSDAKRAKGFCHMHDNTHFAPFPSDAKCVLSWIWQNLFALFPSDPFALFPSDAKCVLSWIWQNPFASDGKRANGSEGKRAKRFCHIHDNTHFASDGKGAKGFCHIHDNTHFASDGKRAK